MPIQSREGKKEGVSLEGGAEQISECKFAI